jgi:hypothetical protein
MNVEKINKHFTNHTFSYILATYASFSGFGILFDYINITRFALSLPIICGVFLSNMFFWSWLNERKLSCRK